MCYINTINSMVFLSKTNDVFLNNNHYGLKKLFVLDQKVTVLLIKSVSYVFISLYGLSLNTLLLFCWKCGLVECSALRTVSEDHIKFFFLFFNSYGSSKKLQREEESAFYAASLRVDNYRGYRQRHGLPVRGQRTCSNAKSCRSLYFHKRILAISAELSTTFIKS